MCSTRLPTYKRQYILVLISGVVLLISAGCGPTPTPEITTTEPKPEIKTVATEKIPLNNCGGNSILRVDIERSREFVYAIVDKDGYEFGGQHSFLKIFLEKEYSVIDGEKETQTHTIHLEAEAHSHVAYTIAWKETWLKGEATVNKNGEVVPYRVKKGLTLEVQEVENVKCEIIATAEAQKTAEAQCTATAEWHAAITAEAGKTLEAQKAATAAWRATSTAQAQRTAEARSTATAKAEPTLTPTPSPTPTPTPLPKPWWERIIEALGL